MSDLTGKGAFEGLGDTSHAVIEKLLCDIYTSGDWDIEHDDLLDEWRAARGDAAKDHWVWWAGDCDDDSYAHQADSREAVIAVGRREYAGEGRFRIVEARGWIDLVKDGEEIAPFADTRNGEVIIIAANDRGGA